MSTTYLSSTSLKSLDPYYFLYTLHGQSVCEWSFSMDKVLKKETGLYRSLFGGPNGFNNIRCILLACHLVGYPPLNRQKFIRYPFLYLNMWTLSSSVNGFLYTAASFDLEKIILGLSNTIEKIYRICTKKSQTI